MEGINKASILEEEEDFVDIKLQKGENSEIREEDIAEEDNTAQHYESKRVLLENTRISKQTWSILEIYQKMKEGKLVLDPDYQRNFIWNREKKTSFIESLFMGIIIPPIYVVEIPGKNMLEETKYEVVDGKQRLSTLRDFMNDKLKLSKKALEYFQDWFLEKSFNDINDQHSTEIQELLSSVLDIYVITANSPEFIKYDIFSRLNKGAAPLKVNEIRKAIYKSTITEQIDNFINRHLEDESYTQIFTQNDIKRFEDYGRFFRSIAYYTNLDIDKQVIKNYNSRPRDMINDVLSKYQSKEHNINSEKLETILSDTVKYGEQFKEISNTNWQYYLDVCIYFIVENQKEFDKNFEKIMNDPEILTTFDKSPSTTSNVNKRVERIIALLEDF